MDSAKRIMFDVASASQSVIWAATEYASRKRLNNVQSCHFRLEKEMQRISVATEGILDVLSKSSLPNGPPLDDRLQDWFSSDELPACLETLRRMERTLQHDAAITIVSFSVKKLHSSAPEDKIDAAVKLFDSRRNYFHFLLTTDVWNCEVSLQQRRKLPTRAQDRSAFKTVPELEINGASKAKQGIPLGMATGPMVVEEKRRIEMDDLRRLDDVLQWLDGLSCTGKQEETLTLRQPDTCTWLHSTPEYESWRSSDNPFLWLQGKPGSGKTVLASFVIDSLKNKRRSEEVLAFFYCDFRNDRSTGATEVLRSLLSQLLRHIHNENTDPGELVEDLVREKNSDAPTLDTVKHLATFVCQAAKQFTHQPLIIVDALDECKDIEKLLDGLLALSKGKMRLFVTSRPLQIIKDSLRGLPSISMDKMTSAVSTDIALHITRELDSRRRLRDLDLSFKMEIHTILCERADGMFRWIQCQIDTLNRCATRAEVRDALERLPTGLDETYERILIAIDPGSPEGKLALRALVWLVGALRPLRSLEILEGLTIDLGRQSMDRDTGPMHKIALLDVCGSLVTYNEETDILILSHFSVKEEYLTGGLTRIKLPRYHISYQHAHEHLARICICYAIIYLKHVRESGDQTSLAHILRTIDGRSQNVSEQWSGFSSNTPVVSMSQELLDYVFTDGFNHLTYLGSANHVVLNDMMALQLNIQRYPDAWEVVHRMSQYHKPAIPWPALKHDFMHYVLIAFSPASLFLAFLRRSRNVLKPKHQTNPLVYAAHFDRAEHAEMLLSRGAKVNERGLIVDASRQALPLEIAVKRRHNTMVDLLLSAGSMVPKRLFTLSTYYYKYPVRIVRRLLETDQFVEWAMEPGNELPSPLRILEQQPPLAYETDIISIIRRLVQVGVDHTEQDLARTTLHFTIQGGYQAIMVYLRLIGTPLTIPDFVSLVSTAPQRLAMLRLVVETGFDVHGLLSTDGDTALHLAIRSFRDDCLEAVKILIGAGCKPFARNAVGKTPLDFALEKGSISVADYLLSQGTPPSDALLAVVESKCPPIWRLETLRALANGEDILGITHHEDALLHREMTPTEKHQGAETMEPLGAGCNNSGQTPLDLVTHYNSPLLTDYLFSTERSPPPHAPFSILQSELPSAWKTLTIYSLVGKGADGRGLSTVNGNTLLHTAVLVLDEPHALEVASLLVSTGCDPFLCNLDGKTPLHIALDRKFSLLADYLLPTGTSLLSSVTLSADILTYTLDWDGIYTDSKDALTILQILIGKGATQIQAADGSNLLHMAIKNAPGLRRNSQRLDIIILLVGSGCDPSKRDADGHPPVYFAIVKGHVDVVEYLLPRTIPLPQNLEAGIIFAPFFDKVALQEVLERHRESLPEQWESVPEKRKPSFARRVISHLRLK